MKKIILFLNIIAALLVAKSQTITCQPPYPTIDSAVTITFDATGTALEGYSGTVYAHTGVKYPNNDTWQNVIGTWGNNTTQPKLTKISSNTYTINITPSIKQFYNLPQNQMVAYLCFVFRSADATKQTADLFYPVYQPGFTTIELDTNKVFSLNSQVPITVVTIGVDSIKLFIDDTLHSITYSSVLDTNVLANKQGRNKIYAISYLQGQADTAYSSFFVRKNNILEPLPLGIKPGINYTSPNSALLAIYAPYKEFIYVVGDFNNWQLNIDYQMKLSPDTPIFWLSIENLTPQQEYAFEYYIDAQIYIADPYCDKILDPWNDKYIPSATYPNLKPFPTKANGIVSVLQTNEQNYFWESTNFSLPDKDQLIIYELHIRDFVATHSYQTLIDTLKYFKKLGINAIELMPINEFEGNESWGYNPSFYFAPDKYYGTKYKLKEFIDSCHSNGIAVIIDMVLNHSFGLSPLVKMYFNSQTNQVTAQNPWYNVTSPNPVYYWGYDFNHQSAATKYFCERVLSYWLTEYNVDGFRMDFTKGFTNTYGDGWAYDASRINILKHYYDVVQQTKKGAYFILEHLTDNSEETVLANYGMMLWGNLNNAYCQASMGYSSNSDFSWISYKKRGWLNPNLVGYIESHDEERLMFKNITYGNFYSNYSVKQLNTALDRAKLAALFFLTIPGPKMIWQFGELGYDVSIDFPCRVCNKPIKWEYYSDTERKKLFDFYSQIIDLRKKYDIFKTQNFSISASNTIKTITLSTDTAKIFIVGNFDVKQQQIELEFPEIGTWYELFSKKIIDISSAYNTVLEPGEYRFYSTKKMFDDQATPYTTTTLAYPNPVDSYLNIENIPECEQILICYSNGSTVKLIEAKDLKRMQIDVRSLQRGVYIIHFVGLSKKQTIRFLKM